LNGAKDREIDVPSHVYPDFLVAAIVALFVLGLGVIIGLMAVMSQVAGFNIGIILAVTLFSLALWVVVEGIFISLLLKGKKGAKEAGEAERLNEHTTRELGTAQPHMLPEPVPSVTEHTTRAFEPVYREQKSK
jgi:hypothetical protein